MELNLVTAKSKGKIVKINISVLSDHELIELLIINNIWERTGIPVNYEELHEIVLEKMKGEN